MRLLILEDNKLVSTLQAADGPLTIGSSPSSFVHLNDPRVGSHQASVYRDPKGDWWLEICDHNRTTHLNRAIQHGKAKLHHADEIEIAQYCIRLFLEYELTGAALQRKRMQEVAKHHGGSLPLGSIIVKEDRPLSLSREHLEQLTILGMRLERAESTQDLMMTILKSLLRTFSGRQAWIGLRSASHGPFDSSLGWSSKGAACPQPSFSETMQDRCLKDGHFVCTPKSQIPGVGSAMAGPLVRDSGIIGMVYLENGPDDPVFDEATLEVLCAATSCIALPLVDNLRRSAAKRQAVTSTEHTVAQLIQAATTPQALPQWETLQLAAFRHPGAVRCCDLYDVIQLRDKCAAILLARLTAEGAGLPQLFAEVRSAFRVAVLHGDNPLQFVQALNWLIHGGASPRLADTLCAWLNPTSGEVRFSIAGERVLLGRIHADGTCDMVPNADSQPAGRGQTSSYTLKRMQLNSGDALVMATDGVKTAVNGQGEAFGLSGLKDSLCDGLGDTPSHVLSEFATDLHDFIADGHCADDISVVLGRRE